MKKAQHIWRNLQKTISNNFKSTTIMYLLIMLVINGYQILFGSANMVLGILVATMMLTLMGKDMTAHPIKNFVDQAMILCIMATAACFSMLFSFPFALLIHLTFLFLILYTYTSDYGDHMYFQYILGYLFLIFIGPISLSQLPMRLLGMIVGAGCILLYQYIYGRGRVNTITRNVLLSLLEEVNNRIDFLLYDDEAPKENTKLDSDLRTFHQTMEHRRKTMLGLSDAGIATMEIVHSLEKLNAALYSLQSSAIEKRMLLRNLQLWIEQLPSFVTGEQDDFPLYQRQPIGNDATDAEQLYQWTVHLQMAFSTIQCPQKRRCFRKSSLSVWERLKLAINFSPMRVAYALRLSCLLAIGIVLVQYFHLEHGKWLLFTITSVSLPYADEVGTKAKTRFIATLIGSAVSLIAFSLIPSSTGKIAFMIASGYLSCYMTDYLGSFSCATIGALGGAVLAMSSTGFAPVGNVVLTRIFYIAVGIVIAGALNCLIFPINQKRATQHLAQKYIQVAQAVSESCHNRQADLQLHYHLLLKRKRLEEKLRQNAKVLHWEKVDMFLQESSNKCLTSPQ